MNYFFIGGKDIGNYILNLLTQKNILPNFIVAYKNIIDKNILENLEKKNVEIIRTDNFKKDIDLIIDKIDYYQAKTMISVAFPLVVPAKILNKVKYPLNVHTALLPKYRGFHPISAAFLNDEKYQGTTIHFMTEDLDAGDIILQDMIEVSNTDDIVSVKNKLIKLSCELLLKALEQIETKTYHLRKQQGEIVFAPRRKPEDSKIDFNNPSRYLHNFIRALVSPYPNAFAFRQKDNEHIFIKKTVTSNVSGEIIDKTVNGRYVVATKDGVLLIETDKELEIGDILM